MIAQHADIDALWTVPPDECVGEMNLYWPACVPYKRYPEKAQSEATAATGITSECRPLDKPDSDATRSSPAEKDVSAYPDIYERSLLANEFRVLCLSAVQDDESPVHMYH